MVNRDWSTVNGKWLILNEKKAFPDVRDAAKASYTEGVPS
jgi:hypothetical protein